VGVCITDEDKHQSFANALRQIINKYIKHSSTSKFLPHNQYDGTKSSALRFFIATAFKLEPTFGGFISGGRRKQKKVCSFVGFKERSWEQQQNKSWFQYIANQQ
jgi:hypothetical protein